VSKGALYKEQLEYVVVQSPELGGKYLSRLVIETPADLIASVVMRYWPWAYSSFPIQGLQLAPGHIELIREWSKRPRDEQLFREIFDKTFISFYTFPAESRHFVFLTNKLDFDDMCKLVIPDDLQMKAKEIGSMKQ
jgi:hypothetical protein